MRQQLVELFEKKQKAKLFELDEFANEPRGWVPELGEVYNNAEVCCQAINLEARSKLVEGEMTRITNVLRKLRLGWDGTCIEQCCDNSVIDRLLVGEPTCRCTDCKEENDKRLKRYAPNAPGRSFAR